MLATDLQRVSALAEPAPPHQPARGAQPAAASGGTAHSRPFPPIGVALYSVLTERCEGKTKDHKAFAHERVGRRPALAFEPGRFLVPPSRSEDDPTTGWPRVSSGRLRLELLSWTRRRGEHFQAAWTDGERVQRKGALSQKRTGMVLTDAAAVAHERDMPCITRLGLRRHHDVTVDIVSGRWSTAPRWVG